MPSTTTMTILENDVFGSAPNAIDNPTFFVKQHYNDLLNRVADQDGLNFWLAKLDEFGGNFVSAEMVKAFITSGEYRVRFGTP